MKFKNKQEMAEWAYYQMNKYGIPLPETYTADEIQEYCPEVPAEFTRARVAKRNAR